MAKFDLHSLVGIGFPSAKAPIVFLDFVPSQSYDRSKSKKIVQNFDAFFYCSAFDQPYLKNEYDSGVQLYIGIFARRFTTRW